MVEDVLLMRKICFKEWSHATWLCGGTNNVVEVVINKKSTIFN